MTGIDPRYYYLTLGLIILSTIVGLIVVFRLQRDVQVDDVPPTESEVMGPLEKAYYSGLMTREEFENIRQSMAKTKDGTPLPLKKPSPETPVASETPTETPETSE